MLSHGFISSASATNTLKADLTSSGRSCNVIQLNWGDINTSGLDEVAHRLITGIDQELARQRGQGIAATRIDYFGHSMGGVIAKWYISSLGPINKARQYGFPNLAWTARDYRRAANYGAGDFRRLITIGAPFRGSQFGDYVASQLGPSGVQVIVANHWFGTTGDGNAVADLGTSSVATNLLRLKHPVVSWYPIVGKAAPGENADYLAGDTYGAWLDYLGISPSVLGLTPSNSDEIVETSSQIDANVGAMYDTITSIVHTQELSSVNTGSLCIKALDLLYDDPSVTSYTSGSSKFNSGF